MGDERARCKGMVVITGQTPFECRRRAGSAGFCDRCEQDGGMSRHEPAERLLREHARRMADKVWLESRIERRR